MRFYVFIVAVCCGVALAGCALGGGDTAACAGEQGCDCPTEGACDPGLTCLSNDLCAEGTDDGLIACGYPEREVLVPGSDDAETGGPEFVLTFDGEGRLVALEDTPCTGGSHPDYMGTRGWSCFEPYRCGECGVAVGRTYVVPEGDEYIAAWFIEGDVHSDSFCGGSFGFGAHRSWEAPCDEDCRRVGRTLSAQKWQAEMPDECRATEFVDGWGRDHNRTCDEPLHAFFDDGRLSAVLIGVQGSPNHAYVECDYAYNPPAASHCGVFHCRGDLWTLTRTDGSDYWSLQGRVGEDWCTWGLVVEESAAVSETCVRCLDACRGVPYCSCKSECG